MRTKSLAAVLTLALAGAASAADPAVSSLEADLPVWDVAAEDLDGDGVKEILAFGCAEAYPPEKTLFVFKTGKNGRYATEPAATLTLKPLVGAGFFAEVDGEAPKEFIAVDAAGAEVFRWKDGAFQSDGVSVFLSLYPNATEEPLFLPAGEDLDGDGVDEWLVPIASGYEVRNADGLKARVYCDVVSEVSSSSNLTITHTLPSVTAFAVPGQESKAVAFLSDEWADFAHGPDWG
jgi:hypothetical protein